MLDQKLLRDDIEYIVHCENDGTIIGPISKVYAHMPGSRENLTHYSTWSMVFHPVLGKYGIQLKNPVKYGVAKWDMGVGGHNPYVTENGNYKPLDFAENLAKEANEEIGLNIKVCDNLDEFLKAAQELKDQVIAFILEKFHYKTEIYNEFIGLGIILTLTTKVEFKDNEVVDFKWLAPKELQEFLNSNNKYCVPLPLAFKKVEKFRLKYL